MYLSHLTIESFYETMFIMIQDYKWSVSDLESMMPWERDIYLLQTAIWVKKRNELRAKNNK